MNRDALAMLDDARALNGHYMCALGFQTPNGLVVRGYNVPLSQITVPEGEKLTVLFFLQPINGEAYLNYDDIEDISRDPGFDVKTNVMFFYEDEMVREVFADDTLYYVDCDIDRYSVCNSAVAAFINCRINIIEAYPFRLYLVDSAVNQLALSEDGSQPSFISVDKGSSVNAIHENIGPKELVLEGYVYAVRKQRRLQRLIINTDTLRLFPICPRLKYLESSDPYLNKLMGNVTNDPATYMRMAQQYEQIFA